MIRQTVLGFKMARTEEQLTARGELALMLEYAVKSRQLAPTLHRICIALIVTAC